MTDMNFTPETEKQKYVFNNFFKWHHEETEMASLPGRAVMEFAGEVRDIVCGINTIMTLLEESELFQDADEGGRKFFNQCIASNLQRMVIATSSMLEERSMDFMDWAYRYHTPEGRAEQAERYQDGVAPNSKPVVPHDLA